MLRPCAAHRTAEGRRPAVTRFDDAVHFAACVAPGGAFALVVKLFAAAQADLDFDPGMFKINRKGDQCQPVLLHCAVKFPDFTPVHQQPPGTDGIAVEDIAVLIGADVHAVDVQLAVFDRTVCVFQV